VILRVKLITCYAILKRWIHLFAYGLNFLRSIVLAYFGCELWSLTNRRIEDLCVAWRKSLRAVWRLPQSTHKYLLHSISHCLSVFDEICRRSFNFIKSCINHHSQLIRFISLRSVLYSRGSSLACQNVLFCTHRLRCYVQDILHGSVDYLINSYLRFNTDGEMRSHANVLLELLMMRDGMLELSESHHFAQTDIDCFITALCTS
jgi:hypothetical protein